MKRSAAVFALLLLLLLPGWALAQPDPGDPTCAECERRITNNDPYAHAQTCSSYPGNQSGGGGGGGGDTGGNGGGDVDPVVLEFLVAPVVVPIGFCLGLVGGAGWVVARLTEEGEVDFLFSYLWKDWSLDATWEEGFRLIPLSLCLGAVPVLAVYLPMWGVQQLIPSEAEEARWLEETTVAVHDEMLEELREAAGTIFDGGSPHASLSSTVVAEVERRAERLARYESLERALGEIRSPLSGQPSEPIARADLDSTPRPRGPTWPVEETDAHLLEAPAPGRRLRLAAEVPPLKEVPSLSVPSLPAASKTLAERFLGIAREQAEEKIKDKAEEAKERVVAILPPALQRALRAHEANMAVVEGQMSTLEWVKRDVVRVLARPSTEGHDEAVAELERRQFATADEALERAETEDVSLLRKLLSHVQGTNEGR